MFPDEKICINKDALPYKDLRPPQSQEINDECTQSGHEIIEDKCILSIQSRDLSEHFFSRSLTRSQLHFASSHFFPERLYTDERSYASFHRPQTFQ